MAISIKQLDRLMRPLRTALQLLVSRVVIRRVREAPKLRTVQITGLRDETLDGAELFAHYGFASSPKEGAEAIALMVGAIRDHVVVIATADRTVKISLIQGEVAIHDDLGQKVHLTRTGIVIDTPLAVNITAAGNVTVHADGDALVDADGDAKVSGTDVELDASGNAIINAGGTVNLGGLGGKAVARTGDLDSNGDTIVGGSAKVFAVD